MAIETHLKTYLFQTGKLTLRGIGTFTIRDKGATSTADQVLPPQKFIHFAPAVDAEEYDKFFSSDSRKIRAKSG